jgi:lysophospholipase L1-like esterase
MSIRNTLRGYHRGIHLTVVAALVAAVGGLVYHDVRGTDRPQSHAEPRNVAADVSTMFDRNPTLLVVGDAFAYMYPQMVADQMGWNLALDEQVGTGFINRIDNVSPPHVPFIDRLDRDAATYRVDYVLIDGGRYDLEVPPERVVAAADAYLNKVHSKWPNAKIAIILPAYATTDAIANQLAVAEGLRGVAERAGAGVIDPVAQRWYSDVDLKPLLVADGVHLNGDGQTYYAKNVLRNLKQMFGRPTLLVVGDSYAGGVDPRTANYPQLVADKMGWDLALDAQGGTGFIHGIDNVSPPHVPFIDRLDNDAATYHADYVLIDGGRNDFGESPERVAAAADAYLNRVHSDWPNAKIAIILPAYARPDVAANQPAVAEGLRRAAERVGASVIDPVAQRWYRDVDVKPLLAPDDVHLNGDGQMYYADKIIENLKQMGFGS